MKTPKSTCAVQSAHRAVFAVLTLITFGAFVADAQAPSNGTPANENILAGALVIPMDNVNQGNSAGTTFNLRAYGLANRLLQANIPVKWVIRNGKAKDDVDFSAFVTRIAGNEGISGPASVDFAGGPFVIAREFDTPDARNLIDSFNGFGDPVTVYRTNADISVDVHYTLTHKPLVAIGPDGGNFGTGVHQTLLTAAGILNFTSVSDDISQAGSCFTLATQAHSINPDFVNVYRQFVERGGNLLLQCASINTFENHSNGHFQTTAAGYSLFGTFTESFPTGLAVDSSLIYPDGSMPFNQFIGVLANQDGAVTDYAYASGSGPANGNLISVSNSGAHSDKFVATVSKIGPGPGGNVFGLGGHDYTRTITGASEIEKLNGQRMILNAIFVPASTVCTTSPQSVLGYKSVRRINVREGGPAITRGDTLEWTIDYVNSSQAHQFDFQIRDVIGEIDGHQTNVASSVSISHLGGDAFAIANPAFNGVGNGPASDLLESGAYLPVGGRIQIKLKTLIDSNLELPADLFNQTTARSMTLSPGERTKTDAIDGTNTNLFADEPPDAHSVPQIQNEFIDPTKVRATGSPTSADVSIDGRVLDSNGYAIRNALVTVINAAGGEARWIRSNAFGFFRIDGLDAGGLYQVIVSHKRYLFDVDTITVSVSENLSGVNFVGQAPAARSSP